MTRDEAVAALDLAVSKGYSAELQVGVHEKMAPRIQCSVSITRWPQYSVEKLVSDFSDTPYQPMISTSLQSGVYLVLRADAERQEVRP